MKDIRLYYISDLHLEFLITPKGIDNKTLNKYSIIFNNTLKSLDNSFENILVIAGDLIYSKHFHYLFDFLKPIIDDFDKTFLILGNHDYWKSNLLKSPQKFKDEIEVFKKKNGFKSDSQKFILLDTEIVELNDKYNLYGSTHWYSLPPHMEYFIKTSMNDYKQILTKDFRKVFYQDFYALHFESLKVLRQGIEKSKNENKKLVVATHHGTSEKYMKYTSYNDCYAYGTKLNDDIFYSYCKSSFASQNIEEKNSIVVKNATTPKYSYEEMDYYYLDTIKCFIHGHSHIPFELKYKNEYDIDTYMNTFGYLDHELFFIDDKMEISSNNKNFRYVNLDNYVLPFILLD